MTRSITTTTAQRVAALAFVVALIIGGLAVAGFSASAAETETDATRWWGAYRQTIQFDVAEDGTRFLFDEAPLLENGMPAVGNDFVTRGYIYPYGTLSGTNGVLPDGSPEFPDKVIGTWFCRGYFISPDGAMASSGPMVLTTQYLEFHTDNGPATLVTEGLELADFNVPIERPITGGTGRYLTAGGSATQTLLGYTDQMGVNLRFEVTVYTMFSRVDLDPNVPTPD